MVYFCPQIFYPTQFCLQTQDVFFLKPTFNWLLVPNLCLCLSTKFFSLNPQIRLTTRISFHAPDTAGLSSPWSFSFMRRQRMAEQLEYPSSSQTVSWSTQRSAALTDPLSVGSGFNLRAASRRMRPRAANLITWYKANWNREHRYDRPLNDFITYLQKVWRQYHRVDKFQTEILSEKSGQRISLRSGCKRLIYTYVFMFYVTCIVVKLCNVNQQNEYFFKLMF